MPKQAPEFAKIVPAGWDITTLLTLLAMNHDDVILSEDSSGELTISTGYKEREDGCLVKIR